MRVSCDLMKKIAMLVAVVAAISMAITGLVTVPAQADEDEEPNIPNVGGGQPSQQLEQRQAQLDQANRPDMQVQSKEPAKHQSVPDHGTTIDGFIDTTQQNDSQTRFKSKRGSGTASASANKPYGLKVNLLDYAKNADRNHLNFSWKNARQSEQTQYRITVFTRAKSADAVFQGPWVQSSRQTTVTVPGLSSALKDNELYYWQVEVGYADGTIETSERCAFATAAGSAFASTQLAWLPDAGVSNLIRAKVPFASNVEKALLTVTALDTEGARRHVFNAYVNGDEVGVGPTRRAGNTVYYNTFDITQQLNDGNNIIGLFSYSQAKNSGVLMQLTYFYADGHQKIIYNSARDAAQTQIYRMDNVVYGAPAANNRPKSIGTAYYQELAQNADVTKFPYQWSKVSDFDNHSWSQPHIFSMKSSYHLSPSIVDNSVRQLVAPKTVWRNSDGSYTVEFSKEIIGDIRLTATSASKRAIRITEGEQLQGGKAKYRLNTGNVYDETWRYQGNGVTFTGYSLRAFRYVTIYNYPGTLKASNIRGVQTLIPYDSTVSSLIVDNSMLSSVYDLSKYSQRVVTQDTVTDSVTRERRPYEGDNLIYQDITFGVSDNWLSARNTWNWCLNNPSQYTEYRLMSIIGVYRDYMNTGDLDYAASKYSQLQSMLKAVRYDSSVGMVTRNSSSLIDLIDWPRSELSGYNFNTTKYHTVINAVAYEAYRDMGKMAEHMGRTSDANQYKKIAASIKSNVLKRCYDKTYNRFWDGLDAQGKPRKHYSQQNDFFVLAFDLCDSSVAQRIVAKFAKQNSQVRGSIYAAYFFYTGLAKSGHGDLALRILAKTDTSDQRTYASVLRKLGATITPEAWGEKDKSNMTYSHVWGTGGGVGLIQSLAGVQATTAGFDTVDITVQPGTLKNTKAMVPTQRGNIAVDTVTSGGRMQISVVVPYGSRASVRVPRMSQTATATVDGGQANLSFEDGTLAIAVNGGTHTIQFSGVPTSTSSGQGTGTPSNGNGVTAGGATYYFVNSMRGGRADDVIVYGRPNDSVLVGDWDGDGRDTLAVRRKNVYYFKNSIAGGPADRVIAYGKSSDTVLVGDWDGDGKDTLAVRRKNIYYVKNSINGGKADKVVGYGKPNDAVLIGDWDSDGSDTLAVRRKNVYYFKNSIAGGPADRVIAYGKPSDTVLVGDWDGDGKDTLAVRRKNVYYVKNSINGGPADRVIAYGKPNDAVLVGDWDGDSMDTFAVRR